MKSFGLVILLICCLPFLGVGLYEAYENNRELSSFARAEGTVVGNVYTTTNEDGKQSGAYQPEVEFHLPTGEKIRFTDKVGSLPPDYETGTKLEIIYPPDNPPNARINSWKRIWLAPLIFITIGLLPLAVGGILLRRLP